VGLLSPRPRVISNFSQALGACFVLRRSGSPKGRATKPARAARAQAVVFRLPDRTHARPTEKDDSTHFWLCLPLPRNIPVPPEAVRKPLAKSACVSSVVRSARPKNPMSIRLWCARSISPHKPESTDPGSRIMIAARTWGTIYSTGVLSPERQEDRNVRRRPWPSQSAPRGCVATRRVGVVRRLQRLGAR